MTYLKEHGNIDELLRSQNRLVLAVLLGRGGIWLCVAKALCFLEAIQFISAIRKNKMKSGVLSINVVVLQTMSLAD